MARRSSFLLALALACTIPTVAPLPTRAAQDAVKDYPVLSYSAANVKAFADRVAGEQADVMKALRAKYPDKPEKHHLRKEQVEDGERQDGAALPPKTVIFKLGLSAR